MIDPYIVGRHALLAHSDRATVSHAIHPFGTFLGFGLPAYRRRARP